MRGKSGEELKASFKNMLLIGSTGRNSGKTVLACSLIQQLCRTVPVIGLKVTTIHGAGTTCPRGGEGCGVCSSLEGDYCVTRETDRKSDKDTAKMLASGAREVLWLRVRAGSMDRAVQALKELIPDGTPVVAESNTLRRVVEPGVFLMVKPRGSTEVKTSAARVLEYADRVVEGDRERTAIDPKDVTFHDGRFFLRREATLVLLAGGGSSRMGKQKSLLEYRGQPLIVYIHERLKPLFSEILVSSSGGDNLPAELDSVKIVVDEVAGFGPIAGIAAGLAAARYETAFITACDIPTIHRRLVAGMLDASRECDVVVPRAENGLLEPLHAVYKRNVLPEVLKLIDSGERRIRMLYGTVNTCYKDLETGHNLANINTLEEYRRNLG